MEGRRALVTEIQALVNRSHAPSPRRAVSDLDSSRVSMLCAVLTRHAKLPLNESEVYASTVGGIPAREPAADLAILLSLASAAHELSIPSSVCAIGEVSLSGDVRRVGALERRLTEAARLGFRTALVPVGHTGESLGALAGDAIRTVPVSNLRQALEAAIRLGKQPVERRPVLRPVPVQA
jgi:DNA repair protein RadA/Sms